MIGEAVRLRVKLNQNTQIKVRTGIGMTIQANIRAAVGQGMLGGALVSQGVLDEAMMEHLPPGEPSQMEYGDVLLAPLMWMDDFISGTDNITKARSINLKVDFLIKQRSLKGLLQHALQRVFCSIQLLPSSWVTEICQISGW